MVHTLQFQPAINRLDLVSPSIAALLKNWKGTIPVGDILVAEIDPAFAGGKDLSRQYDVSTNEGAICVIIEAVRSTKRTLAACVAPVDFRIDFNGVVRKTLNARRVSLAPIEEVLDATQMEYGSVTPVGLSAGWPILIDARVAAASRIIVGAGLVKAKLSLPGQMLAELAEAKIITGLAI
jgi:prolyl-tRNA editing enzyme YbaK/EbsC (Cys-tRNA(Pro) deacylase)